LIGSTFLFLVAVLQRKPQLPGLIFAILTVLAYLSYYGDRSPIDQIHARALLKPFDAIPNVNISFQSLALVSYLLAGIYLIRIIIFQRVSLRRRVAHISDPIANFTAGATLVILLGAIADSLFHWGWVGAVVIGLITALIYLGAIGLFEGILSIIQEFFGYIHIRLKRWLSRIAIRVVTIASYIASLSQRLVPDLRRVAEKLRTSAESQREKYHEQLIDEDAKLEAAHARHQAHNRRKRS
jgi:hypothetical protein